MSAPGTGREAGTEHVRGRVTGAKVREVGGGWVEPADPEAALRALGSSLREMESRQRGVKNLTCLES